MIDNKMEHEEMSSQGQSMAEYGLVMALVAIVSIAGLQLLGNSMFTQLSAFAGSLAQRPSNDGLVTGFVPSGNEQFAGLPTPDSAGVLDQTSTGFQRTNTTAVSTGSQGTNTTIASTTTRKTSTTSKQSSPSSPQTKQAANQGCNGCLVNSVGI
jgi:Flp pilus assembly pilin Flp